MAQENNFLTNLYIFCNGVPIKTQYNTLLYKLRKYNVVFQSPYAGEISSILNKLFSLVNSKKIKYDQQTTLKFEKSELFNERVEHKKNNILKFENHVLYNALLLHQRDKIS